MRRSGDFFKGVVVGVFTLLAYFPALRNGYIWDDAAVTDSELLRSWTGLGKIWFQPTANAHEEHYWPLVYTSFWMEDRLWGLRPFANHLVNVLLHVLNAFLLARLLRRLEIPGAWISAALFALHPVHLESVAWVIERKDVLSAAFYFSAFLAYLRFNRTQSLMDFFASLALFVCAMLSKSSAIALPAILALCFWWSGKLLTRKAKGALAGMGALALAMGIADFWFVRQHATPSSGLEFSARVPVAGRAVWFYAGKLLWPLHLGAIYPQWETSPLPAWAWVFPASATAVFVILAAWRKRESRFLLAVVLFFLVTLLPILGIVDFGFMKFSYVADRFQYLASAGPIALFGAGAAGLRRRMEEQRTKIRAIILPPLGIACLLAFAGGLVWKNGTNYSDSETLFRHNVALTPRGWAAHYNLALALVGRGKNEEALAQYEEALKLNPDSPEMHNSMGVVLRYLDRYDESVEHYRRAIQLDPNQPEAHYNLATALKSEGKLKEAIEEYSRALEIKPDYAGAMVNWGAILAEQGKLAEAIALYQQALKIDPQSPEAYCNLGFVFAQQGKTDLGIEMIRRALEFAPTYAPAYYNLGVVMENRRDFNGAIAQYDKALALQPDYAEPHLRLAQLMKETGNLRGALEHYLKALSKQSRNADVLRGLGDVMARLKYWDDAIKFYTLTLQVKPDWNDVRLELEKVQRAKDEGSANLR